ncbi:PKD domain-containing protein [Nocardioides sp. TF02-7]|uniref:PKD domain-containing protein n=1 Tax=Nocardioides sp. TF02-7 TaxID=2917724 RepID=UPI001F062051|nr:PKD domain-containing protein [Nocardioides sp. TF02-7]UMG94682.1 PKD domain-containing protein [Nocardioides sp. TF02-7]
MEYAWTFGDGGTATGPDPDHRYRKRGTYTARVTVTDPESGSEVTDTVRVRVTGPPADNRRPAVRALSPKGRTKDRTPKVVAIVRDAGRGWPAAASRCWSTASGSGSPTTSGATGSPRRCASGSSPAGTG